MASEEEQFSEYECRKGYVFWTQNEILSGHSRDRYKPQQKNGAEAPLSFS